MSRDASAAIPVLAVFGLFAAAAVLVANFLGLLWAAALLALFLAAAGFYLASRLRAALAHGEAVHAQALGEEKARTAQLEKALADCPLPLLLAGPGGDVLLASRGMQALPGGSGRASSVQSLFKPEKGEAADLLRDAGDFRPGLIAGTQPVEAASAPLENAGGRRLVAFRDRTALVAEQKRFAEREKGFAEAAGAMVQLAQRLASASELMSASAEEQAENSRRQKDQTDAVAQGVDTVSEAIFDVAGNASGASDAAEEAKQAAFAGVDLVTRAVSGNTSASEAAGKLAEILRRLDERAGRIGDIIGVINDIADQTNLLALNAAIEAARAGDAGRGFAVVADEVRKLAEKTMSATREVGEAVSEIQTGSGEAVTSMEETGRRVEESTGLSGQVGEALESIKRLVEDVAGRVGQIAQSSESQSAAAEEIKRSTGEIAQIARDAYEGADQQAQATKDLAKLSQELLGLARRMGGENGAGGAGGGKDDSRGKMKGILPKLMQDYIRQTYGEKVFAAMDKEMGGPVFLPQESYPDGVIAQMADIAARLTGTPRKKILHDLGFFTPGQFARYYKQYFKARTLKEFLLGMDAMHVRITRDMPGVHPPKFTYEDKGDVLFMNYRSPRALFDYFEGVIKGSAAHFKTEVKVEMKPLDAETTRAEIRFL
ncbi:methyl-accepting chemotaxis sensory transducer with HNOB (heme) sensor [Desulfovibrio sp. X2]|uniref:methyl-accepting chemotaxis protein n=1 Tax=Desulfovibrio sp. X2 TaxID=941449 RepID=UPI00035878F0|nr:methyl-accepting chemotaxis protein [Desulfovibrio sp. X2]EPR44749.1 methyl-accepting chemotaxis sensory transducer with HNOB (heme) sensor [Desulfovibrio sp. X2]